ncbi:uroporphyrinogen-III synthase isoform X3 [Nilaparvata lugens]|uniref:uroporphyrinogen-III synthase isoform X3 n=1 Tax=Nilaparvata lugens TaxID=108931 RepID=UPI00193CA3E9|nr:uroporphyrinogen-III synthase isoform X3 [Nilaparvata lugens]XP_039275595.1 uroporphyrinogen-III synthase isoform X3 [Nilaparvata lugens]
MKLKVLIFKANPGDTERSNKDIYQQKLEDLGFESEIINVIQFNYKNLDVLKSKFIQPNKYSAIVFSSPRCVKAVANAAADLPEADQWESVPCFAVGEATARLVKEMLAWNALGAETGSAEVLAPLILKSDLSKPVLMPVGNLSRETICNALQSNGVVVDAVQVYETAPHSDLRGSIESLALCDYNAMAFFSPSGVNSSVPILRDLRVDLDRIKFVAIGPTTERALLDHGLSVSATASKPTPEALAQAVSSVFAD